jgi:hypothetical protein
MQSQDVQCKEETVEKESDILCSSTGAGFSGEVCALVVGSASLAEVYKLHGIKWKLCKECGVNQQQQQEGSHDAQFESELVLGVDHCCMCKAKEQQQQEMINDCHSADSDGDDRRSARGSGEIYDDDDRSGSGGSDGSCIPEARLLVN